ncbi:uncharacterized protein LOC120353619 [Nilaparvata lugens]|uniref:uncharacterized protein LOC120353619 n=1 Tax=Nilaparvata lugens TaxID=108931 RepID=UPI00193CEF40|nr:uncharacterized protein LOC120353619 [Nilaparvata lugens]
MFIIFVIFEVRSYENEVRSTEVLLLKAASKEELSPITDKLKRMRMELAHLDTHFDVLRLFNLNANILIKLFNFGILILITGLDIRKVLKSLSPTASSNSTTV